MQCCWSTWVVGSRVRCGTAVCFEDSGVYLQCVTNRCSMCDGVRSCRCGAGEVGMFKVFIIFVVFNVVLQHFGQIDQEYVLCVDVFVF